jgi:hypothetical protein
MNHRTDSTNTTTEPSIARLIPEDWSLDQDSIIFCPACGGENPADAVFCGNHSCHKALGEFKYVLEELNHPRQSRGLIVVSPSKGHVHESPKGDYLFPKTELFIMLLFFFLLPYICLYNLFIQPYRRYKISSGPKVFSR